MTTPSVTFKAGDLPIQSVTVYSDRAQIKRELKTNLEAGKHEIVIENATRTIDQQSIRVDGSGTAEIREVVLKRGHHWVDDVDSPEIVKLLGEKKDLEKKKWTLNNKKGLHQRQLDTLNCMAGKIGSSDKTFAFDEDTDKNMTTFFAFYSRRALELKQEMFHLEESVEVLNTQIQKFQQNIDDLRRNRQKPGKIVILVDIAEGGEQNFVLSYQVHDAKWSPLYDIRVVSAENPEDKTSLKIDYFAQIVQDSGEEWTNAKIFLSTAQPCLGGNVPELSTLTVSFFRPPPPPKPHERRELECSLGSAELDLYQYEQEAFPRGCAMGIKHTEMTSSKQVISTEFELQEKKTIPSDSSEHKMLITNIAFEPSLLHECVPKKSTNVFLTASVVNNSEFPLIEGDAAVYLNHNFVAKTHLKAVAPGEKFTCSLGVDNAVKVAYKAPQKFNTESGMFSKQATVTYTQHITIQNNKASEPITILIKEHVPRATDDKLKVKLLEPFVELPKAGHTAKKEPLNTVGIPGIILNSDHNLEWTEKIEQGGKKELVVKWQIDYPTGQKVQYNEDF
ncbi:hypothetical protein QR680_007154 [Steinernema hermaphroditum]|uniref:DUF4139 domain-containing protein n=1 Tax=Steinernema hermaphroditum TaxID=289476 RepID=A0AA39HZI8_9BILA|nr:hypothetical protein QR680_007154 [Steinernema hermaphroditum]